jgi:GTP-binding protein
VLDTLDQAAVSYQVVLTKADEVKTATLADTVAKVQAGIARRPAAFPTIAVTSSRTKDGLPDLRAGFARLLSERGVG